MLPSCLKYHCRINNQLCSCFFHLVFNTMQNYKRLSRKFPTQILMNIFIEFVARNAYRIANLARRIWNFSVNLILCIRDEIETLKLTYQSTMRVTLRRFTSRSRNCIMHNKFDYLRFEDK